MLRFSDVSLPNFWACFQECLVINTPSSRAADASKKVHLLKRGTAKSGSLDRLGCKTAPNGRIDLKLSMEGSFGR